MTRKEALKLLQLSENCTEKEIRRQFKKMAMKLHPDVNNSDSAHEAFILLTQAQTLLLHKEETTISKSTSKSASNRKNQSHEQRMEEAKMRFEKMQAKEIYENRRYFERLTSGLQWFIFKIIVISGVAFSFLLVLDSILPKHRVEDRLNAYWSHEYNGVFFDKISGIELQNTGFQFAKLNKFAWLQTHSEVIVEKTWFLHTPIAMYSNDEVSLYKTQIDFHVGSIRWYLFLFLLIPLIPYFYQKKSAAFTFVYLFSFWGVGLTVVYLIASENRFIHILCLGFI